MVEALVRKLSRYTEDSPAKRQVDKYSVEKSKIEVRYRRIDPAHDRETLQETKSVNLFLPGFSEPENTSALDKFCGHLSNRSENPTYIVDTSRSTFAKEAKAVRSFLEDKEIKQVHIVGHSMGGDQGMHITHELEENTDIKVTGLTMLNPVGLYPHSLRSLSWSMISDVTQTSFAVNTGRGRRDHKQIYRDANRLFVDSARTQINNMRDDHILYLVRLYKEIKQAQDINPHTHSISAPIVILTGEKDKFSHPSKIIPNKEMGADTYLSTLEEREEYLKTKLFSNSEGVRMLIAKEMPHHVDFILRPITFANVALNMHERMKRKDRKESKKRIPVEKTVFSVTA